MDGATLGQRVGLRHFLVTSLARAVLAPAALGLGFAPAFAEEIPLTVRAFGTIARTNEPVTSGIPISPGQVGASWALFDGTREIPVQTTVLPHRATPWLLLDFQTSLGPNETRSFRLTERTPTASPSRPVTVSETSTRFTVTTGPLRTEVSKVAFNLLDRVWFDRSADGMFSSGDQVVSTTSTSNLIAHDAGTNRDFPGRGPPRRMVWEYLGPMRATLRVDGAYATGSDTLLAWTTRLTWYAGQSSVRIDHVLRNSLAARERYVKLTSARLRVPPTSTPTRIERSGSTVWTAVTTAGATLDLIPATVVRDVDFGARLSPPSAQHWFGTDDFGRDVFSRVLYGARLSMWVGGMTVLIASASGILLGLLAGYFSRLDNPVMRVMDGFMAFPSVILAIAIMAALGPQVFNVIVALAVVQVRDRVRAQVLQLRQAHAGL